MTPRRAPIDVFAGIVEYFPTISLNLIVENGANEFLFVMRGNQPVKGHWWLPGGRMLSGESIADAALRVLREETNLAGRVAWISSEYKMEVFERGELDERERAIYSSELERFHYLTIPVHIQVDSAAGVAIDDQSKEFRWSAENLSAHAFIADYFEMWRKAQR